MQVIELIKILQSLPEDAIVKIENRAMPLVVHDVGMVIPALMGDETKIIVLQGV